MSIDMLIDNIIFLTSLPDDKRPRIEGTVTDFGLKVTSPLTKFTGALTIDGNVGIGTQSPTTKLEVKGRIKDQTGYLVPVGSVLAYIGKSAPDGWLLCDGKPIPSDDKYKELRDLIGPNTPNLCLRTIIGAGTNNEIGNYNISLNTKGGEWSHTLSLNEIPSHTHDYHGPFDNYGHRDGGEDWTRYGRDTRPINGTTTAVGGNQPHNNMQPYHALNYIIKY